MVATLDQFLASLGDPGKFQIIAFLFLWSNTFPLAFNNFVMVYYGIPPAHHCKIPQNDSDWSPSGQCFKTILDSANQSVGRNASLTGCDSGWEYSGPKHSIVSEWDLVCDRKWDSGLSASVYFVGVMLGSMAGGLLGDMFGRQPVILVTIYLQAALGLGVAFVPSFEAFVTLRFFHAFILQAMQGCSFTLTMELFRPRMRTVAGTLSSMAWPLSTMILALVTYLLDDWRHVQLALTLPSLISFAYFWFIPESLRWLVSLQKVEQAQKLTTKIAKFNKVPTHPTELCTQLAKISKECAAENAAGNNGKLAKYGILDLFRTPTMRKFTFIISFLWFTASLVVYGISFSLPKLGANIYISFGISGAIELAVRFVMFYVLDRFGRKWPTMITLIASGAFCVAVPLIQAFASGNTADWLAMIAAIIGKSFMSACFSVIPMYTTELYPTVIRSLGQGMAVFATRIGGILSPQLAPLAELWKPAPFLICGCVGVIAGFLTLFLPETNRLPMPDMIEDVESGANKRKVKGEKVRQHKRPDIKLNGFDSSLKPKPAPKEYSVPNGKEELGTKIANGKAGKTNETFEMDEPTNTKANLIKPDVSVNGIVNTAFEPEVETENEKPIETENKTEQANDEQVQLNETNESESAPLNDESDVPRENQESDMPMENEESHVSAETHDSPVLTNINDSNNTPNDSETLPSSNQIVKTNTDTPTETSHL